jgi:hypothetical protein
MIAGFSPTFVVLIVPVTKRPSKLAVLLTSMLVGPGGGPASRINVIANPSGPAAAFNAQNGQSPPTSTIPALITTSVGVKIDGSNDPKTE